MHHRLWELVTLHLKRGSPFSEWQVYLWCGNAACVCLRSMGTLEKGNLRGGKAKKGSPDIVMPPLGGESFHWDWG